MHIVDIKALPLGVVTSQSKKEVTVAVSGMISTSTQLVPGRNYYGDNNGKLVMGEYVGSMNTESYYIYDCTFTVSFKVLMETLSEGYFVLVCCAKGR